jgi:hypothetical protein
VPPRVLRSGGLIWRRRQSSHSPHPLYLCSCRCQCSLTEAVLPRECQEYFDVSARFPQADCCSCDTAARMWPAPSAPLQHWRGMQSGFSSAGPRLRRTAAIANVQDTGCASKAAQPTQAVPAALLAPRLQEPTLLQGTCHAAHTRPCARQFMGLYKRCLTQFLQL